MKLNKANAQKSLELERNQECGKEEIDIKGTPLL